MAKYDFLKKDEKNKGSEAVKTSGKYDFIKPKPKPPTLGDKVKAVGKEVVKGIVSPVVTTVARPFQAAAALGGVSDEKINEFSKKISGGYIAPTPQNTSDVVKDVGRAAQTVLMGTTGATLKAGSKIGARLFPATAKTTAANLAKYKLAGETLALGAEGAGIGAGVALEQGGAETTAKDLLKSSAIGAVTGAVAPLAIKGAGRLFKGKAAPVVEETVEKTAVTPKPMTPQEKFEFYSKSQGYEPVVPDSQLPSIDAGPTPPRSTLPTIQAGEKTPTKLGSYSYEPIKDVPVGAVIPEAKPPRIQKNTLDNTFERQTNKGQKEVIASQTDDEIDAVLFGGAKPKNNVPVEAYLSTLQNKADELALQGDTALAEKLSKSNIFSQAGQGLQAASMASKEGLTGTLRAVRRELEDALPASTKAVKDKEIKSIQQKLSDALSNFKETMPNKKALLEVIESMKCP